MRVLVLAGALASALSGSASQLAFAGASHPHACTCVISDDGTPHHCRCPKCRGPSLGEDEQQSPFPELAPEDCGDDVRHAPAWFAQTSLVPEAAALAAPLPSPAPPPSPDALCSRFGPAPPLPPPRAA